MTRMSDLRAEIMSRIEHASRQVKGDDTIGARYHYWSGYRAALDWVRDELLELEPPGSEVTA